MNRTGDKAMAALRADWLTSGGEMGKLIRGMDWSWAPVGPIDSWPQSLKTAVYILLNSRYPMFIWWGRELTNIYNDAYMPILGARHPQALGRSAPNVWADVWPVVGPQAEVVMREGRATWNESILLVTERHGYTEETYFTFSYSPAPDDAGGVGGVFCAVTEDTARVLGARRLKTLRDLGEHSLAEAKTAEQACRAAAVTLANNLHDFPFALIYLLDADGKRARLCETVNLPAGTNASPSTVNIGAGDDVWNFSRVIETSQSQIVEDLEERFGRLPAGPWTDAWTKRALALPLAKAGAQELPAGFLVAGTSPRLAFNDDYRSFFELAAGQIANAISNARAYEEERKRAEALAEIDRAKTTFFSNVSHEFRTPLTLMLGPLEDALAEGGMSPEARELLKVARRNSLRLLKLVNMLLDFSRIEAGRIQAVYEPVAPSPRPRVLLADDNADMREYVRRLLGGQYEVEAVADGEEALKAARERAFDLILSDVMMPRLDGFGLLRELREGERTREIPVILLSARAGEESKVEGLAAGANDYLVKPFSARELLARVEAILQVQRVRRESQEALRSSERKFSAAFNQSPLPMVITSLDDERLAEVNESFVRLSGYTREEALGRTAKELRLLAEWGRRDEGLKLLRAGQRVYGFEARFLAKSGEERVGVIRSSLIEIDSRPHVLSSFTDLTERKRAEDAIGQLAAIVESSDDAIVSKDLNGVIMSWNKGAEKLFGYSAEEVIGKSIMILIPPDRADEETRVLESVRRGEKIDHYETVRRRKDGAFVEISLTVSPVLNKEGNVIGASKIARDINERKRVEQALAEGARQQRALYQLADHLHRALSLDDVYNAALDAILDALRCDRASILLFDDAGVMRFVGWRGLSEGYRKAVEGHSPWKPDEKYPEPVYLNDIDMAEIDDSIKAVVKVEGIGALAFIPLVSRGKLIGKFMTYFNAPHVFSDDELALSLTIARQLAFGIDRKRAEELLRQNAAQLTLITNTAPVFIAHCDAQARFKFVNKPYAERFGLTPEDCIGKRFSEVVGAEAYESLRQHIEVALSGEPVEFEVEVPYAAIGRRFMHSSYAPEFDANGKVVGFVAAITDITERKKAEQNLIATTAKFESVFNQSGIYAGMMDLQGYLREVNDLAVDRCGYTREQVLDRLFWETPWWRGSDEVKARIRAATEQAAAGMVFREELPYWWADGTERVAEFAMLPIRDQDGGVMLLYPTGIDITERKRAEEEIARLLTEEQEAREVAEQATRAKDEFLAIVSHELRSPLNAILGWNRLLRSQRGDDPEITKVAETVERSGKAQLQLIEDLLDTARIITGKMKLEFQPVEPVAIISAALDTVRPAAESKGVLITTNLDPKAGQITGDPDRLQQVVWNLVSNAIKFTPRGGRVRVELRRGGVGVQIVVDDTGQGINPNLLPFIFDRFKQGDTEASRRFGGLGLGLALVKHLVELHGGSVAVESPGANRGATFIVNLPVRAVKGDSGRERLTKGETEVERRVGRRTRTAKIEGVRALVVDDEPGARELLTATLEQYGVLVTGVDSTSAALAALESQFGDEASEPFDILISDIGMPGADGYELIQRVRAHANGRMSRIRAIALTAYARTEDRLRALRAGFQMHVPKPVDEEELTTVIAALTDRM